MRLTSLGREKLDVSRYCGMTLSNLACHRQNRVPIVHAGGLKPLCDMAFDGERLEMQRAAGLALYNLSCAAANQASPSVFVGRYRQVHTSDTPHAQPKPCRYLIVRCAEKRDAARLL